MGLVVVVVVIVVVVVVVVVLVVMAGWLGRRGRGDWAGASVRRKCGRYIVTHFLFSPAGVATHVPSH